MKIVNHREFDKEYFEAKKKLYGTDIELIQDGDGIDTPMKVKIAIPGVMMDFEEAAVHAHVGVCHLISGNRTRIDPVQDGISLLGHHGG